jgi:hypothetical protein
MSRATELADQLEALDKGALTSMWARDGDKAVVAELRRLDRVEAELLNELMWLRGYLSRYDPPGLPNHIAQRIDAALTSATKEQR